MLWYLLDTSLCVRVLRDRFNANGDALAISTMVLYDLLYGAEKSAQPEHNRREVERFAARLEVLPLDVPAAAHAADLRAALAQGWTIGAYDLQIAGDARSRGLVVVTGSLGAFERVDGLIPMAARIDLPFRRGRSPARAVNPSGRRYQVRGLACAAAGAALRRLQAQRPAHRDSALREPPPWRASMPGMPLRPRRAAGPAKVRVPRYRLRHFASCSAAIRGFGADGRRPPCPSQQATALCRAVVCGRMLPDCQLSAPIGPAGRNG